MHTTDLSKPANGVFSDSGVTRPPDQATDSTDPAKPANEVITDSGADCRAAAAAPCVSRNRDAVHRPALVKPTAN